MGRLKTVALIVAALIVVGAAAAWMISAPQPLPADVAEAFDQPGDAAAGKTVFFVAGCESCHMGPGQPDPLRLGGGQPLKTPFGVFYPPNISPDRQDGIGGWSGRDFANALMAGVSRHGEHLYPAFPYPSYRRMSVKDARDLLAFLRTLPPVAGKAQPTELAFPFSVRRAIGFWKRIYLPRFAPAAAPDPSNPLALGRYLVNGPGHCAECHSPRDALGGIVAARRLAGGPLPDGKGKAPNITADGLKDWSEADIAEALSSGFTPSGDSLGGPMAAVVRNLAEIPAADRAAIARYLKTVKAGDPP